MKKKNFFKSMNCARPIEIVLLVLALFLASCEPKKSENPVARYDVTWDSLGTNENSSMPLGNGDVAMNAWTEQNGDIVLLIAKSDSWSENGQLLKLGKVRISLSPNPFINTPGFTQTLRLETGEMELKAGNNVVKIWADANHPVIRVDTKSEKPTTLKATTEIWRKNKYQLSQQVIAEVGGRGGNFWEWKSNPDGLTFDPDTVLQSKNDRVSWCHFNSRSLYPLVFEKQHLEMLLTKYPDPILHRCFGITMKGDNFKSIDNKTLVSAKEDVSQQLQIYALTDQADSPELWRDKLDQKISEIDAATPGEARLAHEKWWDQFWNRSWINVSGTSDAEKVSQSYAMQRYLTACAGRGASPIKFNGSLFSVGHELADVKVFSEADHDPDYRAWGASYWNQNTRHIYWPLIASGDYDMIAPWFKMYVDALPLIKDRTRQYFNHDGGAFIETISFWGLPNMMDYGWKNPGPELESRWMRYHIQGGLEVLTQMLDYFDNTQDNEFARNSILPMADAVVAFYNYHWKRGADGKILLSPSQAIETYQETAVNPTPDIAGLKSVLPRLLSLSNSITTESQRWLWTKMTTDLPDIAKGKTAKGKIPSSASGGDQDGLPIILPAQSYGATQNIENPESYTVFPYRLYGIGKPDLDLAINTFAARLFPLGNCWGQDGEMAALLGLTEDAKHSAIEAFTTYGNQKFPWFWAKTMDWIPDVDNGGGAMTTLQYMLMQCDGNKILLLPAWPKDWTADFKLHASFQTTVEGRVENGKIINLKVTPESRAKDVAIVGQ